ncbi:hypothetical protein [Sporosarcina sp. FSL K6-3457]|uniref:hypothetical protein n=1 Tax=Sporosarcina sp. FSL K6-3457 TaxID=2978204 RepID=UPI0030F753F6
MFKRNQDIRDAKGGIPFWIIAERLGIHENTLHNWMKHEMEVDRRTQVLNAIERIRSEMEMPK